MVLAVATLLLCGFMVAIYRILRAEERHLARRQGEHRGAEPASQNSGVAQENEAPEAVRSLVKAGSQSPQD